MAQLPSFFNNWLVLRHFKRLKKRLDVLASNPSSLEDKAVAAEKDVIEEQIDHILTHTSADVIKKYRSGARIQPISNYNIKEIDRLPINKLANIRGIGPKSANAIKECTRRFITEVRSNERLHLSPDNSTSKANNLVKTIYCIDKLDEIASESRFYRNSVLEHDNAARKARAAANPIFWLFSRDREAVLFSLNEINNLLNSPLITEIENLEIRRSAILKAEHDEYWQAFCEDPARYYSILEECGSKKPRRTKLSDDNSYLEVLDPDLREKIEHVEINNDGLNCILRPYQKFGVKYILNQNNVLLGDEMGLGKTIEAIATIVSLRNSGATHFVVVCPASVLINWEREIRKHSDLRAYVLHGSDSNVLLQRWSKNGGVAVINYENTHRFHFDGNIALTVVDEAHYIKNRRAARTRNTIAILNQSQRRLLMSGTPLENKLDEMVSLISLLQPSIVNSIYALPQPINQYSFRRVVAPVYFRRTKDTVWREMPALQEIEDVIELSPAERELYTSYVQQRNMTSFTKMRQISFEVDDNDSSKLKRIKEICEEAFENGRKVIVFSFYLNTIERVQQYLGENVFGPITGSISPQKRQQLIDEFSNHMGGAVLLSQILAGGTGLNIQKASIVIMCEPQYKPSIENQAIARAYRIGQTSNVTVYRLLNEKTIDERILQIIKEKQALFDAYADKSDSGNQSIQLSEAELAKSEFDCTNVI